MMNLSEFLGNWDGSTLVFIKTHTDKVFSGKIADVSADVAGRYCIPKAGVKHNKGIMYITVYDKFKEVEWDELK